MAENAIIGALRVVLGMDSAAFEKGAKESTKTLATMAKDFQATGKQLTGIGTAMSVIMTAGLAAFAMQSSKAATDSAQAFGQVEARLQSMGYVAGFTADQLAGIAGAIQDHSLYDDDDVLRQVTATLLTFGNVAGDSFKRGQQAAVDLSAALGQDLQSSTVQIGKALNDPIKGITALQRVGVSFTQHQKDQIATMVKANDVAKAQGIILTELEKEFGGAAQKMRDNDPFAALAESGRNLSEAVGGIINKAVVPLVDNITKAVNAFNALPEGTQKFVVGAAAVTAVAGPLVLAIGAIVSTTGTLISTAAAVGPVLGGVVAPAVAAGTEAWQAYMLAVTLVGPAQATAQASALALGAAIDFALGPIGLAIAAIGAVTAALVVWHNEVEKSKIASVEFTTAATDLKTATDAYADAALKAALATGEDKKSAEEAAKQAKVLAQQKLEDAKASLAAAQASLALAEARQHEWLTNERLRSGNPMTGGGALGVSALADAETLRINKAQANLKTANDAIADASKSIQRSDAVIAASNKAPAAIEDLGDKAGKATDKVKELADEMQSVGQYNQYSWEMTKGPITDLPTLGKPKRDNEDIIPVDKLEKIPSVLAPVKDAMRQFSQVAADSFADAMTYGDNLADSLTRAFKRIEAQWLALKMEQIFGKMMGFQLSDSDQQALDNNPLQQLFSGIGHNASGTRNWGGGLTWVGEKGRELLNVPQGSQIFNEQQIAGMVGAPAGGPSLSFDLRGAVMTSDLLDQMNALARAHGDRAVSQADQNLRTNLSGYTAALNMNGTL